jgi:2'-5' RNA ligase
LARVKGRPPGELNDLLDAHPNTDFGRAEIATVEFLQSELRPEGARYTVLASISF